MGRDDNGRGLWTRLSKFHDHVYNPQCVIYHIYTGGRICSNAWWIHMLEQQKIPWLQGDRYKLEIRWKVQQNRQSPWLVFGFFEYPQNNLLLASYKIGWDDLNYMINIYSLNHIYTCDFNILPFVDCYKLLVSFYIITNLLEWMVNGQRINT